MSVTRVRTASWNSAADAGIEYALGRINLHLPVAKTECRCNNNEWCPGTPTLANNTEYCVMADNPDQPKKITAVGRTGDTKIRRSLEVLVPVYAASLTYNTFCFGNGGANLSPNAYCTGLGYAGATGFVGAGADCNNTGYGTAAKPAQLIPTVDGTGANRSYSTIAGTYYEVQCYK